MAANVCKPTSTSIKTSTTSRVNSKHAGICIPLFILYFFSVVFHFDLHFPSGRARDNQKSVAAFFTKLDPTEFKHPMFSRLGFTIPRATRGLHTVPKLKNQQQIVESGISGVYSPAGFKTAWLDYQKYLTTNLSLHTVGSANETRTPYFILLNTAKQTTEQHTFHYASQAHNNHFFFQQLGNKEDVLITRPSRFIMDRLADLNIPTVEELKNSMLKEAEKLTGQGWVFLVELPDKSLKIIRCNNDGTPYFYGKNQLLDMNGSVSEETFEQLNGIKEKAANGELDLTLPLLALNCWDVAYLTDYGITGKSEYLSKVWDCINWEVVNKRLFQV